MIDDLVAESDALHAEVRAFVAASSAGAAAASSDVAVAAPASPRDFDALALAIAAFQARRSPGFARLVERRSGRLDRVDAIPAVPAETFRLSRVAVHPPELDVARFFTSGTTDDARGCHAFRTTDTYRALALAFGRPALFPERRPHTVVALAPFPGEPAISSLGFMLGAFMQSFDGRALDGGPFVLSAPERWLLGPGGIDLDGIRRAALIAAARSEPLVLLATSLALGALVDALEQTHTRLRLPPQSRVMQTGGTKGRTRALEPELLPARAAEALGIPEDAVVSEYGMTELSSQLYEGTLPGAALAGPRNVLIAPPWLRVTPVDPATLEPVPDGAAGLACFVDLGNVDSAVAVVTRDRIRRRGPGFELLGREPGAEARGCSLAVEAWLEGPGHGG